MRRQPQRRLVALLDARRLGARLRRAGGPRPLPDLQRPAARRRRHRPGAAAHARPARARSRRLPGRPRHRRSSARRGAAASWTSSRLDGTGLRDAHRSRGRGRRVERSALEPAAATPSWPRAWASAAGSTSCASIRRPARLVGADPRPGQGRGAHLDAGRPPRSSSAPTATASRTSTPCALADGALLRVSNVLGGAFTPDVAPDGRAPRVRRLLRRAATTCAPCRCDLEGAGGGRAVRRIPIRPSPGPSARRGSADRPYRPAAPLLPRFWTPYVVGLFSGETKIGVATGRPTRSSATPTASTSTAAPRRVASGSRAYYQYDRFRPTLSVIAEDTSDPAGLDGFSRTQALTVRATLPVARSLRSAQTRDARLEAARRDSVEDRTQLSSVDLGGIEAAWSLSSARQFPYSISPVEGWRLCTALLKEDPALGSDVSLWKATADARAYTRRLWRDRLALPAGWAAGHLRAPRLRRLLPARRLSRRVALRRRGDQPLGAARLRGRRLPRPERRPRERRVPRPAGAPAAGLSLVPRLSSGTCMPRAFVDVGEAWSDAFEVGDLKPGVGVSLGADFIIGHHLPLTGIVSLARGLASRGDTQVYARIGLRSRAGTLATRASSAGCPRSRSRAPAAAPRSRSCPRAAATTPVP